MYYALIGDMVGSKRLSPEKRREAQEKLRLALENVNCKFAPDVAAKFIITLGDECQGLMRANGDPVSAALAVMRGLKPFEIRFSIGFGEIVTPIDPTAAIGADGPAFHLARRRVEAMKTKHGARLRFALSDPDTEETLNTVAALCDKLALDMTEKQYELVYSLLSARISGAKLTQTELASVSGVGQSTVNAQLASAGFNEYCGGVMYIRKKLAEHSASNE